MAAQDTKATKEEDNDGFFDMFKSEKTVDLTIDGGVMKEILQQGKGERPVDGCAVDVHYIGRLKDGTVFDSSRERKKPYRFTVGEKSVIEGYNIAVRTMQGTERCKVTMAAKYAYGEKGMPPKIPPNATLIFEMELMCWYSNPCAAPPVKDDPEYQTKKMKAKKVMDRRQERCDALTNEEERIRQRFTDYATAREEQFKELLSMAGAGKDMGNGSFKAKQFEAALGQYEAALEMLRALEAEAPSLEPKVPGGRKPNEHWAPAIAAFIEDEEDDDDDTPRVMPDDAATVIKATVEDCAFTDNVKERIKSLEDKELSGATIAIMAPELADALIHESLRRSLVGTLTERILSLRATLLSNKATVLFSVGRFEESASAATEAIKSIPDHQKSFYRRALAREQMGPKFAEAAFADMAAAVAFAAIDGDGIRKKQRSLRVALHKMALKTSEIFLATKDIALKDFDDRGRTCFAKKRFAPGEVLFRETTPTMFRVSSVDEFTSEALTARHKDGLAALLEIKRDRSPAQLMNLAVTVAQMSTLYPARLFTEPRLKELIKEGKKKKSKAKSKPKSSSSSRTGKATATECLQRYLNSDHAHGQNLNPSYLQRLTWSLDEDLLHLLKMNFSPLPLETVVRVLYDTINLNSHDLNLGGFLIGHHVSFINHACWPNVDVFCHDPAEGFVVRAVREIKVGDELFMSYIKFANEKTYRIGPLYQNYGFICQCLRCGRIKDEVVPAEVIQCDDHPFVAKGTEENLQHHHRIWAEQLERIQNDYIRAVARGREEVACKEAVAAMRKWLNEAKHFYHRCHPMQFDGRSVIVKYLLRMGNAEEALPHLKELTEIHARTHPTYWPWSRGHQLFVRELALHLVGGDVNVAEAEKCRKTRELIDEVHTPTGKLGTCCMLDVSKDPLVFQMLEKKFGGWDKALEKLPTYLQDYLAKAKVLKATEDARRAVLVAARGSIGGDATTKNEYEYDGLRGSS